MAAKGREELRPVGYGALVKRYGVEVIPNWHQSWVARRGVRRASSRDGMTEEVYPARSWPGETAGKQLEFAVKHDGINLGILSALFEKIPAEEVERYVRSRPVGKYARRIWFLYEFLTGATLNLPNVTRGNYVDLLDRDKYYAVSRGRRVRRQRIHDNLLGGNGFCPMVRRTTLLNAFERANLVERCRRIVTSFSMQQIRRAMDYLYVKEAKCSTELGCRTGGAQRQQPTTGAAKARKGENAKENNGDAGNNENGKEGRTQLSVSMLHQVERDDFCEKERLVELQNCVARPGFREADYRKRQTYAGETVGERQEWVCYVSPKPEDLNGLMEGLIAAHGRMREGRVSAVIHAAAIGYGLAFLRPFEEGNGIMHRFLIQNILTRRGFAPEWTMFPVSAAMLRSAADYEASLDAFCGPLTALADYSFDGSSGMTVRNETARWYRYIDMTAQAEALFQFIEETIHEDLAEELDSMAAREKAGDREGAGRMGSLGRLGILG